MSEPVARAAAPMLLDPGLLHWTLRDERIDFRSDAYAVAVPGGVVAIDPLPLEPHAETALAAVTAVVLTGGFHQRACWSFRRRFGSRVYAPAGASGLVEQPDVWYGEDHALPGDLVPLERPGPTRPHFVLTRRSAAGVLCLFSADLLMRAGEEAFSFVPDAHQEDPQQTRRSVRRLLDLGVDILCPAHGAPEVGGGTDAMRVALERDGRG